MRVIVVCESNRYNLAAAEEFGELKFLMDHQINPFHVDRLTNMMNSSLENIKFDPRHDFVCLTGQAVLLSVMCTIIGSKYHGETIKFLVFDATTNKYKPRKLELGNE